MKKFNVIAVACLMAMSYVSANAQNEENQVNAICGQVVRLSAEPVSGYNFVKWVNAAGEEVSTANPFDVTINGEEFSVSEITTFKAIFEAIPYEIIATTKEDQEGWGSITIDGGATGNVGDERTLVATPTSACYRFVRWENEAGETLSTSASYDVTISANEAENHYVAIFEQVTFQVKVESDNESMGTVTIAVLSQE